MPELNMHPLFYPDLYYAVVDTDNRMRFLSASGTEIQTPDFSLFHQPISEG